MKIFAISDLHLSFDSNKPMDIFGTNWVGHVEKIKQDWESQVKPEDVVLLPGDFSWAMHLEDTKQDFAFLESLPGKKILLKGNHDYWWTTLKSMREFLAKQQCTSIDFLYNNSYCYKEHIIAGTRGWSSLDCQSNKKMLNREQIRLELSIKDGIKKYGETLPIIVCMHYPPADEFHEIMKKYPVKMVIYGHLHGNSQKDIKEGNIDGICYKMVSCDYTNFKLIELI